jgi:hypothetical protein
MHRGRTRVRDFGHPIDDGWLTVARAMIEGRLLGFSVVQLPDQCSWAGARQSIVD